MKNILKEPLIHFVLLGIFIYWISTVFDNESHDSQQIIVSEGKIKHLATLYEKTWQRPPNKEQLQETIQAYILEQAAYLEGVSLGLDKNDIVITRRVRQKLDFIAEEKSKRPAMTDKLLTEFLQANKGKFLLQPRFTFKQVFFDPNKRKGAVGQQAMSLLTKLKNSPSQNIDNYGERYLFRPAYNNVSSIDVSRLLGREFSNTLNKQAIGQWQGPIESSYGLHLVYISNKEVGKLPPLQEIRSSVIQVWEQEQRNKSKQEFYDDLLVRYPATIQWAENNTTVDAQ